MMYAGGLNRRIQIALNTKNTKPRKNTMFFTLTYPARML
jgi:hypothetical protein